MKTWVALLRGINVGGNNILPMKELRALVERQGMENVRTYIQSGNCVFNSAGGTASALAEAISDSIERSFGFRPSVFVMEQSELALAITRNPYAQYSDEPKAVHFLFLRTPAAYPDFNALRDVQKASEQFELTEKVFYLYAPDGVGRSKLAATAEKKLGVAVTARNLRTVLKLAELAG